MTIELWGGVEPTVNRVGDTFHGQLDRSGHLERGAADLDRFAALGLSRLRQPVLWELVSPDPDRPPRWDWVDRQLERLRELELRPIAGLLHHGSGPAHVSLVDPTFPEQLAAHARRCAERYPWIDAYTPINEPITTARFSTLYGLWYPHARDDGLFCRAVVNQCKATVLAMQAIREVNPRAMLIPTDDAGVIRGTEAMRASTRFENERRWLGFDLLCGRVRPGHPFWRWLKKGVSEADLSFFLEHPCPPDIIGLNYYLTSDRFLDERLELYPPRTHGGNRFRRYADVEAVRTPLGIQGHRAALMEAWERYRIPVALTEVHLDCTREEQLRWLLEAWTGAHQARADGADVRAITPWALLGAFDWNSLVTRAEGYYETGAFDVRSAPPRPTAVARLVHELATGQTEHHPAVAGAPWWRPGPAPEGAAPVCVVGADGALGATVVTACTVRGLACHAVPGLPGAAWLEEELERVRPWALVVGNGDGLSAELAGDWAGIAAARDVPVVFFSTARVFDGNKQGPYVEGDAPSPATPDGAEQLKVEAAITLACEKALIVRTSVLFGAAVEEGFTAHAISALSRGQRVVAPTDEAISPSSAVDVARTTLDLLIDGSWGLWHLANAGTMRWVDFARSLAVALGVDDTCVEPVGDGETARQFALTSEKAQLMTSFDEAFTRFAHRLRQDAA